MILFLKGLLIGIGKMIPGVSGGLIALNLHVYEKGVYSLTHLNEKESFHFLIPIGCGILVSMVLVSHFLLSIFTEHYTLTMSFFIGLLCGGIQTKDFSLIKRNQVLFFLSLFFLLSISFFPQLHVPSHNIFFYFFIGIIEAITIIIPGISGTALLMSFGCYTDIVEAIGHITSLHYLPILLPFFIGLSIGSVLLLKLISNLLEAHKDQSEIMIFAFSIASICLLIHSLIKTSFSFFPFSFCVGYFLSSLFQKTTS